MNLNDLPKRQRWLLFLLDQVLIEPLLGTWSSNAAEIVRLQNQVAEGRNLIFRAAALQRSWTEMRSASLPHDPAQSEHDVIAGFETWSRTSGVELGSVKPLWKRGETEEYSLLECRLDATGTLGALTRFLFELERSPTALRVESVELTSHDDTGDRLTLSLVVTGLRLAPLEGKS
jgi:hypothetical protein